MAPLLANFSLRISLTIFLLMLTHVAISSAQAQVQYILARKVAAEVNTICLGKNPINAIAWDDRNDVQPTTTADGANVVVSDTTSASTISDAKYIYIGDAGDIYNHYCAASSVAFLFNSTASDSQLTQLPDTTWLPEPVSTSAFAAPIWVAPPDMAVQYTLANGGNEAWEVSSSLPYDPIVPPSSGMDSNLAGSFFNRTLDTKVLIQTLMADVLGQNYDTHETVAAIVLDVNTGETAYYFFIVYGGSSTFCQAANSSLQRCVVGHAFEGQFDVSHVDFPSLYDLIQSFNDGSVGSGASRRLLGRGKGASRRERVLREMARAAGRRRLTGSSLTLSKTRAGALSRLTCTLIIPTPPGCVSTSPNYPACRYRCV